MSGFGPGGDGFEEILRSAAEELGRYIERSADHVELDELVERLGVDPATARSWVETAGGWLRAQAENVGEELAARARHQRSTTRAEVLGRAAPHPLDLPSDEQGLALAALESGRWTVEPGSEVLVAKGEGPFPRDALGIVRELRVRDWIAASGELTLVGRHALRRWLEVAGRGS
jgi:hypothetical protein